MGPSGTNGLAAIVPILAIAPEVVAAQAVDPSVVVDAPAAARATGAFLLVAVFGGAILTRYGGLVDRSIDDVIDRPERAILYGLMAYGIVGFLGTYAVSLLGGLPVLGRILSTLGVALVLVGVLALTGLGFLVVGTLVTDLQGVRRPWRGLLLGASVGAVGWLILPPVGGLLAWIAVAAFGIGGPVRTWFHASKGVDRDGDA